MVGHRQRRFELPGDDRNEIGTEQALQSDETEHGQGQITEFRVMQHMVQIVPDFHGLERMAGVAVDIKALASYYGTKYYGQYYGEYYGARDGGAA